MLDDKEFNRWFKSAIKTLESAKKDLNQEEYNWACFKAHQAAEKALKALLWGVGKPTIGHTLPKLYEEIEKLEIRFNENIRGILLRLNKFYTPTRYPDVWTEGIPEEFYSYDEALEAIKMAETVLNEVDQIWKKLSKRE